jgi:DNA repair protein RecN (Recombination protein N)
MLTQIHISNLVTIRDLHLDLRKGTIVITGETGAGKSILIDAIELALGSRITGNIVRPGQEKADISLCFDISNLPAAREWLKNYDLDTEVQECIIRRTITQDGRSRSYINSMPSTLQPLRELSEFLINIHGQHEHQALLQAHKQRDILDRYAGHFHLVNQVQTLAEKWQEIQQQIIELRTLSEERTQRGEFLKFQLQELENLQLQPNEFQTLDLEHKQLAHADELLQNMNHALQCLTENDDTNALSLLNQALLALETIQRVDPKIVGWIDSIKNAIILVSDTEDEIRHYLDNVELDPERLQQIEQRIGTIFDLARKHKIAPQELYELQQNLSAELSALETSDERLAMLAQALQATENEYLAMAKKLSQSREKAAKKLQHEITNIIHTLALPHAEFAIHLEKEAAARITTHGLEKILFQIKTNSGQTLQPLHKVVSGGELSRISLAIHMATTSQHTVPTLIFDEVDVGIGGSTAEIVGKHLRALGKTHQVLCITHQPQVAAQGHDHIFVRKIQQNNATQTHVTLLSEKEKIDELARMLGGIEITGKTLAHAKEMREKMTEISS